MVTFPEKGGKKCRKKDEILEKLFWEKKFRGKKRVQKGPKLHDS